MSLRLLLPTLFLCSFTLQQNDVIYDTEMKNETMKLLMNQTEETSEYRLFDTYYPLMIMLISMPENETESLLKYVHRRTYAELKRMIDEKQKTTTAVPSLEQLELNSTDLASLVSGDFQKYVDLVEAYHNASIYGAIRGLWNSKLSPIMPPIDQLAVLEYFAERSSYETLRMSFWSKLWAAIRAWLMGEKQLKEGTGCNADSPRCVRTLVEKLPLETRVDLDRAVEEDNSQVIENIVTDEINTFPETSQDELKQWRSQNEPPAALREILASATETENESLERLRKNDLIHSLKDYYRTLIESRSAHEQEEIRQFFRRMNESFARCFNPIRGKFEFNR